MLIGSIGRSFGQQGVGVIDIHSHRTLLDFDIVLLDLAALAADLKKHSNAEPHQRRRAEIEELLRLGRTVVAFLAPYSLDLLLPIKGVTAIASVGSRTDFKGPDQFKEFWKAVEGIMHFEAYLNAPVGRGLLYILETERIIGSWLQVGTGNLIFLPSLPAERPNYSSYEDACELFIRSLKTLISKLTPQQSDYVLPKWSLNYGWEKETQLTKDLGELQRQATDLERNIEESKKALVLENRLKFLLAAKGDVLAEAVIEVLKELGIKVQKGEPGRDDLILEFDRLSAVVEVKGKKASAAEADAAQLEKWVAGFKEENDADAKGILLVNAFCETPLVERTQPAFPHQMLKYSTQREHCLVTTTQLLGLLFEARAYPEKRMDLVNSLFSAVGIYQEFSDWRRFLIVPPATPAKRIK